MPILDFFKKAPKGPSINVRIWMNIEAKEKACIFMALAESDLIFIAWSKVTFQLFLEMFSGQNISNEVMLAKDVLPSRMRGRNFVFLERHYDHEKELEFLKSLNAKEVLAHVSLSDPLMNAFNSDRIKEVLDTMGHEEDEYIEHKMINKSIERAMEKIKNDGLQEDSSEVLKEWMNGFR